MFMAIIYNLAVVNEAYSCEYVENICPMLYIVLRLGWLESVHFSGTEVCNSGFCSGAGFCIGALWVSYSCTGGTYACSYGSGALSLVVQPLSYGEINVEDVSCC